jgi:hypothetical protein
MSSPSEERLWHDDLDVTVPKLASTTAAIAPPMMALPFDAFRLPRSELVSLFHQLSPVAKPNDVSFNVSTLSSSTPPLMAHVFVFESGLRPVTPVEDFIHVQDCGDMGDYQDTLETMENDQSELEPPKMSRSVSANEITDHEQASSPTKQRRASLGSIQAKPKKKMSGTKMSPQCDDCGATFSRSDHLKRHIKSVHIGVKSHVCPACHRSFARSDDLHRHVRLVHAE